MKKILLTTIAAAVSAAGTLVAGPAGNYYVAPTNYSNAYTSGQQAYQNQSYAAPSTYSGKGSYVGGSAFSSKGTPAPLTPPPPAPISFCSCFEAGNASFSIYGASVLPEGGDHADSLGGGIGVEYFFSRYLGLGADATWAATDSALHAFSASLIARLPFDSCFAPYVFGGGGVTANSATQGTSHIGAGFDWRFNEANCFGLFADGRQTYGREYDFVLIRLGLKWNF